MAKKLQWFRVNSANQQALESIEDEKLGKALKAALQYFAANGQEKSIEQEINKQDTETRIAFMLLKQGIDESIQAHKDSIENGKKGAIVKRELQTKIADAMQKHGGEEPTPNLTDDEETAFNNILGIRGA